MAITTYNTGVWGHNYIGWARRSPQRSPPRSSRHPLQQTGGNAFGTDVARFFFWHSRCLDTCPNARPNRSVRHLDTDPFWLYIGIADGMYIAWVWPGRYSK